MTSISDERATLKKDPNFISDEEIDKMFSTKDHLNKEQFKTRLLNFLLGQRRN